MACDVEQLIRQIVEFRDKRNWAQFHNPKDLTLGQVVKWRKRLTAEIGKKKKSSD
jgi:hypothetical protein